MKIGEMKDRITFLKKKEQKEEKKSAVVDLSDDNYEPYKKPVWAKVEYWKTTEIYSAKAVNVLDTIKFIIRYRRDIKSDMRIKFNDDIYEIKGKPRPLDSKKMYLLIVGEGVEHE
ncbi:phage head closure protein [Inediibacterium massiliense]|uniref:phage head closure protein n=1 Tax=Inediibacterium massiliense TaxID=1658111 RepID=UPI0006B63184|nr:phage head closure protein [Inediibacterium massiliense]